MAVTGPGEALTPSEDRRTMADSLPTWLRGWRRPLVGPVVVLFGALVLIVAGTLPVWGTRLIAPQYPKGLELWFYGGRVEGPLSEVNGLNHYIGMQPIDLSRVPEMALWPLAVVGGAAMLAVAVLWRGWIGRLALLGLWLVPITVLADIQRWLIIFGNELDPTSALRLDPFVPWVVGPSRVWNFTVWTYPGAALVLFWAVALAATLGRRAPQVPTRLRFGTATAAVLVAAVGAALVVMPAMEPTHGEAASGMPLAFSEPTRADAQTLIAEAASGSTVTLPPGTYLGRLLIDKPLTVAADGEVHIRGDGRGSVITIASSDVTLRGLAVAGSGGQGEDGAGVMVVDSERVSLEGLRVSDSFTGISVLGGADVRIVGSTIAGSGQSLLDAQHATAAVPGPDATQDQDRHADHGPRAGPQGQGDAIHLWAVRGVLLRENVIHDVRDGVYLNYADEVLADSNRVSSSRYAIHAMFGNGLTIFGNELRDNLSGLVFMYSTDVLAGRNVVVDHQSAGTGVGVVLKDVTGVRLAENVISRNRVGLRAEGTGHVGLYKAEVLRNRFGSNGTAVSLTATANMGFGGNSFEANLTSVLALEHGTERKNQWTYQGTGNTWSEYAGYDLAGDGKGDVAHVAHAGAQVVFTSAPALELYSTSPAYHLLSRAQALSGTGRAPVVVDTSPLTIDVAAAQTDDASPPMSPAWLAVASVLVGMGLGGQLGPTVGRLPDRLRRTVARRHDS
jgi:nitrous oxidase accessory protein